MKRYDENQGYRWWSWMEYLWENIFNKVEDKIFDIKNAALSALIGMFVIPIMVMTFGTLSLTMLIPHTFEWAYLSLMGWVDKWITDGKKPFMVELSQGLLAISALIVISPFLIWTLPKIIYSVIKEKREKQRSTVRDIQERLSEIIRQQERREEIYETYGDYLRRQPKPDFVPKKRIKSHSLKDKKGHIFVSPGVYTIERDYSYIGYEEAYEQYTRRNITQDPWGGDNDNYRPMEYNEEV